MRLKLIPFSIFLSLTFLSYAQTHKYFKMPDSNAQWNIYSNVRMGSCAKYTYSITGDTLINNKNYHKLWAKGSSYEQTLPDGFCDFSKPSQPISYYAGAFREDTNRRKVFFIQQNEPTEELLYDYSAKIGDTIVALNTGSGMIVKSIDSILINFEYRKVWGFGGSNQSNAKIIEGIGSTYGLLQFLRSLIEGHPVLDCFSVNNKTIFPKFNDISGCPAYNSIIKTEIYPLFTISPNPSNGKFFVHSIEKEFSIEIFNMLGEIIFKSFSESEIDITSFKKGLYYVKLSNSRLSTFQKIIFN